MLKPFPRYIKQFGRDVTLFTVKRKEAEKAIPTIKDIKIFQPIFQIFFKDQIVKPNKFSTNAVLQ